MRKRRNTDRGLTACVASAAATLALRLCALATRRPVDAVGVLAAASTSLIILVNAVFLQSASRSMPFIATPTPEPVAYAPRPVPTAARSTPSITNTVPQPIAVRHNDPIAELIGPSSRIAAVQRALSEYGYGQIRSSGMLDDATASAIEKFEREHKLPITARVSERLVTELTALVGHPIE